MVKSAVQVCIRTRPTAQFASDNLKIDTAAKSIAVHLPKAAGQHINNQQEDWSFKFDQVLHNASQEGVYDACAADIVSSVLEGYNGTLLAYGQTGAGKTFTMTGGQSSYKYRGVIPRAIAQVFKHIDAHPENEYLVRVSYLEIYNETFFDLLQPNGGSIPDLAVCDDERGAVHVKGLTQVLVTSEEDALNELFRGETNRAIADHQMNSNSTRSHCIFTVALERRSRVESNERIVVSKLNLVDLAGSERVGKTGSSGAILREAKYINKSLTFLEQVVIALSSKTREHVPFRQSKLTNVLRDSLGGNCRTRLIANVWAEKEQLDETISTLKFATRMMRVSNDATVNVQYDQQELLKKYERQIRELKQELAMHDTIINRTGVQYDDYTVEERKALKGSVDQYIRGDISDIPIDSLRQVRELFHVFRTYIHDLQARGPARPLSGNSSTGAGSPTQNAPTSASGAEAKTESKSSDMVGELDTATGFHLGIVPSNARPPVLAATPIPMSPRAAAQEFKESKEATITDKQIREPTPQVVKPQLTEAEALQQFRCLPEGVDLHSTYQENKEQLKTKNQQARTVSEQVNETKRAIDELNAKVQLKRQQRENDLLLAGDADASKPVVIDEEEYLFIKELKEKKQLYQRLFEQRKQLLSEAAYLKGLVDQCQRSFAEAFLRWFEKQNSPQPQQDGGDKPKSSGSLEDSLDDGERFEALERQRLIEEDPDSVSFFNAQKTLQAELKKKKQRAPIRQREGQRGFV